MKLDQITKRAADSFDAAKSELERASLFELPSTYKDAREFINAIDGALNYARNIERMLYAEHCINNSEQ